ncbi:MAG: hypothetical protein ABII12_02030 [Planctomycetota bacterium]
MSEAPKKTCQGCGGEITAEQIAGRQAGLIQGVLLCPNCVAEKRRKAMEVHTATQRAVAAPPAAQAVSAGTRPARPPIDEADVAISLIDDDEMPTSESRMIRSFAAGSTLGGTHQDQKLKRPLGGPTDAATRIRTFHAKLTDAGLANLDDIINEWIDANPGVFIKSTSTSVGIFESKKKEPHLFVTIFY